MDFKVMEEAKILESDLLLQNVSETLGFMLLKLMVMMRRKFLKHFKMTVSASLRSLLEIRLRERAFFLWKIIMNGIIIG